MEKIAIFSLTTSKPQMLTAILKDGALIINEVKPLPASALEQKQKIPPAIAALRKSKFKVLVDEITPTISAGTGASRDSQDPSCRWQSSNHRRDGKIQRVKTPEAIIPAAK